MLLRFSNQLYFSYELVRIMNPLLQYMKVMPGHSFYRLPLKQVCCIFHFKAQLPILLGGRQGQIKFRYIVLKAMLR
ncbi:hypothetical protein D3C74_372240 [compost metagenome]